MERLRPEQNNNSSFLDAKALYQGPTARDGQWQAEVLTGAHVLINRGTNRLLILYDDGMLQLHYREEPETEDPDKFAQDCIQNCYR